MSSGEFMSGLRTPMPAGMQDLPLSDRLRPVIPLCVLVDASSSIKESGRTGELNGALARWPERIASRPELAGVEIAVVVFGPNHRAVPLPLDPRDEHTVFVNPSRVRIPTLSPAGTTPLATALSTGLKLCLDRSAQLRGTQQRRIPNLAVITDGRPTDADGRPDEVWRLAATEVRDAVDHGQLRCFGVALRGADEDVLRVFADPVVASDKPIDEILEVVTYASAYGDREDLARRFFGDI